MTAQVILVGGVPGAGKTTALRQVAHAGGVRVLDPEELRDWFGARWPRTAYRRYRWLVHTLQAVRLVVALLAGPDGRLLLVHDPATRSRRRVWFARLARARGWQPSLVFVDASRAAARSGQVRRGRVVGRGCFDRHWVRWETERVHLGAGLLGDRHLWEQVLLVERDEVVALIHRLRGQVTRFQGANALVSPRRAGASCG